MADEEIYFDPADFEDEDDEPVSFALDAADDDDDADDDDADWFFVPEGAGVSTKEEDLFVVGDDYDDDDSFGFAQGFADVAEQDADDETEGYRANTRKGAKSNLRRRDRNTPVDIMGVKDGLKADVNNKGELTSKQLKELAKKEEETEKMLQMGVPKALLRKLESEKRAVDAFNVKKQKENSRRTHKRLTIVAGTLSRRKLLSPSGLDTRPMMGMVRGATFDMITSLIGSRQPGVRGSRWLDLFAGTGAIGIEAISRGCVECASSRWTVSRQQRHQEEPPVPRVAENNRAHRIVRRSSRCTRTPRARAGRSTSSPSARPTTGSPIRSCSWSWTDRRSSRTTR